MTTKERNRGLNPGYVLGRKFGDFDGILSPLPATATFLFQDRQHLSRPMSQEMHVDFEPQDIFIANSSLCGAVRNYCRKEVF